MRTTKLNMLTDRAIKNAKQGFTSDGGGLSIRVRGDKKVWIFRYSFDSKRCAMGMGSYPTITLVAARQRAAEARQALSEGCDPKVRDTPSVSAKLAETPTFRQAMDRYLTLRSAEWGNQKHVKQWSTTLDTYVADLMRMPVDQITTRHVAGCLTPIWQSKAETASRVRQRIERILSASIALGERDGPNPAMWRDNLELVLGKQKRPVKHHAAVPVADAPEAFAKLWARRADNPGATGAVVVCLTVLRSGPVRQLTWSDIDGETNTIPAKRMKARRAHRVPVVPLLDDLLAELPRWSGTELVLPGVRGGTMHSDAIRVGMRCAGLGQFTPHGWRSSFTDWAAESGWNHRWTEDQLAHTIGTDVERAYRRGDYLEQRRPMILEWAKYLTGHINRISK